MPYDKDFVELVNWLKAQDLIVRVPKNGPVVFHNYPGYWKRIKELTSHESL